MPEILDTVLLLALPASGKSEVRRYLAHVPPDVRRRDFHMGPTVQLDDFPYVHMMRRTDEELAGLGAPRAFFRTAETPFQDPRDWGTLIELINEDHADLLARRTATQASAAALLLDRIDAAARRVGIEPRIGRLSRATRSALERALESEARKMLVEKHEGYPDTLAGKTLVIEFARGGPSGAAMPLAAPLGYGHSLALLSPAILERAAVLYIWVTPEESRRKNAERSDPKDPGSILHHGVPIDVMLNDYGCDDMDWLEARAPRPGTLSVQAHGRTFELPVARFDNRVDRTSFIRKEPAAWRPAEIRAVEEGLRGALARLAAART
jgi:hypothetical protein